MNLHLNHLHATVDAFKRSATSQEHKRDDEAERDLGSFEPGRWLVTDGTGKTSFNANAIPSLAFGGGYRGCLGECTLSASFDWCRWSLLFPAPFHTQFRSNRHSTFAGVRLARMEFRIVAVLLILSFEFLPLPDELRTTSCTEKIFRQPDKPYARLRVL